MNARRMIAFPITFAIAFALSFAGAVHAHDCTGGADGGMDATGNQCNAPDAIAAAPDRGTTGMTEPRDRGAAPRNAAASPPVRVAGLKPRLERTARGDRGRGP